MQYLLRFRVRYLLLHIKASGRLSVASISPVLEVLPFLYPFLPNKNSLPLKPRPSRPPSLTLIHPTSLPPPLWTSSLSLAFSLEAVLPFCHPSIPPPARISLPQSLPPSLPSFLHQSVPPSPASHSPTIPSSPYPLSLLSFLPLSALSPSHIPLRVYPTLLLSRSIPPFTPCSLTP